MDWAAIWSGVIGRCRLIEGVWIEPVTAQLMMTLDKEPFLLQSPIFTGKASGPFG
jgi:hypothetical protein